MSLFRFSSLLVLSCLSASIAGANSPQAVRDTLQKWVETERLVSKEEQVWQENKAALRDLLTALGKEQKILKEKIKATEGLSLRADKERAGLLKEREQYQKSSGQLSGKIEDYERQVANLFTSLPPILQQELNPLKAKLDDTTDLSLSIRARTVISMIAQIEKFDNTITLTKDVRRVSPDREVEVDILYLGLAHAFYVDRGTEFGGWGEVTPEGWYWQEKSDMAPDIREAIDVYESRKTPVLVELPLKIKKTGLK